jgi:hypothetical protein
VAADRHLHRRPGAAKRFRQIERNAEHRARLADALELDPEHRFGTVEE